MNLKQKKYFKLFAIVLTLLIPSIFIYNNNLKVISKVDNIKIRLYQIRKEAKSIKESFIENGMTMEDANTDELHQFFAMSAIETLENKSVLKVKAKELNLLPTKSDISEYKNSLEQSTIYNISKKEAKDHLIEQNIFKYITKDISLSEDEIQETFEENIYYFSKHPSAELKALVFSSKDEAEKAHIQINGSHKKFDEMSKTISTEELGFIEYVKDNYLFHENIQVATKDLNENQISEVIEVNSKYYIIKKYNVSKETIVPKFEDVKERVSNELIINKQNMELNKVLTEWKEELVKRITLSFKV